MKYEHELKTAIALAKVASKTIMHYYGQDMQTEIKSDNTPVTIADKAANKIIYEGLHKAFPLDGIISEEMASLKGSRNWYIDPIDGTKEYVRRFDQFSIHIGFCEKDKPSLGIVHKPTTGETYWGMSGIGAYRINQDGSVTELKTRLLRPNPVPIISQSLDDEAYAKKIFDYVNADNPIRHGGQGLRMIKVAENIADFNFSEGGKASTWDICAPHAIIAAAGGIVKYSNGNEIKYFGQRSLEDNPITELADLLVEAMRN